MIAPGVLRLTPGFDCEDKTGQSAGSRGFGDDQSGGRPGQSWQ
jgi:hypothetical protein